MKKCRLGELKKGESGMIRGHSKESSHENLVGRLLEMGLLEGAQVELIHEAPFGKDPIAVRVRGALIALRRQEANLIEVEV